MWYNKYYAEETKHQLMCTFHFVHKSVIIVTFLRSLLKNQPVDSYLEHLLQEFHSYDIQKLRTLYIGGGTPTALSAPQLEVLLDGLTKSLDLSVLEELTIEANPGDLDEEKIAVLKNSAVNRVSLGVQTFDDKMLKRLVVVIWRKISMRILIVSS